MSNTIAPVSEQGEIALFVGRDKPTQRRFRAVAEWGIPLPIINALCWTWLADLDSQRDAGW